ncbi:MAG: putative toxin-antitoxin system toxin component, PIN family [Gammaproteobacteria bacterium]|nr:putative toxin-antitoxin system toxin component, PIN family [Gammaproteobacteria bacterium]
MRVFLDTNVLVAAFATRGLCEDVMRTVLAQHELIVGEIVLFELERILEKKMGMPRSKVRAIVGFVRDQAKVIDPSVPAPWPENDADDQWVLAAALEGAADILVTGDQDLLEPPPEITLPIVTPRRFWESLR